MPNNSKNKHSVICFGWMGLKTAVHALQRGATAANFTVVVEKDKNLMQYFPEGTTMPHIIEYTISTGSHRDNWMENREASQALSASMGQEKLILITDLDSQECTYALIKFIGELAPAILQHAFLIAITPLLEESPNWKRALPYLSTMKAIPVRKGIVHLPELIRSHQLEQLTPAKCEKYFCAYINNVVEAELG